MSECDYLLWLSIESSERILFLEGAMTIGSEVFQVPICATQSICNLHSIETTIEIQQCNCRWTKFAKLKLDSDRVRSWTIAVPYYYYWFPNFSQITSTQDYVTKGYTETNGIFITSQKTFLALNTFQVNVPLMKKPGS